VNEEKIASVLAGTRSLRIDICDDRSTTIGYLTPITSSSLSDEDLLRRLTEWRNRARERFFSQATLTCTQTAEWMRRSVLTNHNRLLFVINADSTPIGTVGFTLTSSRSAEQGNLIRGESGGGLKFMQRAHRALLQWLFQNFDIDNTYALVFADNFFAVNHLRSLGFVDIERIAMYRREGSGSVHYEADASGLGVPRQRDALKMELRRSDFLNEMHKNSCTVQSGLGETTEPNEPLPAR
jgi:RimJ/RimL family protein N-acetyltransferase